MKSSPDHGYSGSEVEIELNESALLDAMGREPATSAGPAADPSVEFRNRLRAQFLGKSADAGLAAWTPDGPRPEFTVRLRASFLSGGAPQTGEPRGPRAAALLTADDRRANSVARRVRWAAVAGVLAAAAALLLFFQRGPAASDTWTLDVADGDESALLAALLVDGEPVGSIAEFGARMATARRVETLGQDVRIRHRNEFVLELAANTIVGIGDWIDRPEPGQAQVLHLDVGGVRVATGPDFDPTSPLVVETVDVRTEAVGTIFGVDVASGLTCVCCLEGSVQTTALHGDQSTALIGPERTHIVLAEEGLLPVDAPLVSKHRAPLEGLVGYWS